MKFTRAIALCGLTLAIALAIGAVTPMQPYASAGNLQPIFSSAPERARPTPALATAEPTAMPAPAAQVIEQLRPTPLVIYIQLPPPQVVYVEQPAAPVVEQPAATAGEEYQLRRLDAINSGKAYRPKTR